MDRKSAGRYALAIGSVLAVTALSFSFRSFLRPANLAALYLLVICWLSSRVGRAPAVLASTLGVALFDYCFITPYFSFQTTDTQYVLTFAALLAVSLGISDLTAKACEQANAAVQREQETLAFLEFSRALGSASGEQEIRELTIEMVRRRLGCAVSFVIPAEESGSPPGARERAASGARVQACEPISDTQQRLLEGFAQQATLALERDRLAQLARQADVSRAAEALETTLLNSISHDLRSPLVAIQGALLSLQKEAGAPLQEAERDLLIQNALIETDRLNRFVANLMQITRLETGHLALRLEPQDVREIIDSTVVLTRNSPRIQLHISADLPAVAADFVLFQQALWNVLDNALKFCPQSPVHIGAGRVDNGLEVWVRDFGDGIPESERELVFQRFYRSPRHEKTKGSGLGLPISKGLVEAMGGWVSLQAEKPGTRVRLGLKLARMDLI